MTTGIQTEVSRLTAAKGAIAQAIEAKGVAVPSGTKLDGMATLINGIEQGSDPVLQSKTVTPATSAQTVSPDSGYDGLSSVTVNAMPTATQATPSISINSSTGVITASATQSAGYVAAGTKSATQNLTTQGAATITPSASSQTAVAAGRYTTGAVTVAGDSNLVAGNIKSGVSIFGVAGTYEGSGGGGGSEIATGSLTITNNGMYEPGTNEYLFTASDVDFSTKLVVAIVLKSSSRSNVVFLFRRGSLSEGFETVGGFVGAGLATTNASISGSTITAYGVLSSGNSAEYIAV